MLVLTHFRFCLMGICILGALLGWRLGGDSNRHASASTGRGTPSLLENATRGSTWKPVDTLSQELRYHRSLLENSIDSFPALYNEVQTLPNRHERLERMDALIERWVELDVASALATVDGSSYGYFVYKAWAKWDADAAVAHLVGLESPSRERFVALDGLAVTLAKSDPGRLFELDERIGESVGSIHQVEAARTLASNNLEEALNQLKKMEGSDRAKIVEGIAEVWATHDPEQALAFARSQKGLAKRQAFRGLLHSWSPEDLEKTGELVQEINGLHAETENLAQWHDSTPIGHEVALDIAAQHGAEVATAWAHTYLPEEPIRHFYESAVRKALSQDAESLRAWLDTIDDLSFRQRLITDRISRDHASYQTAETWLGFLENEPRVISRRDGLLGSFTAWVGRTPISLT